MNSIVLIKLLNEIIPLLLSVGLGVVLHRGLKRNQMILGEREDLLRRYIMFRGDKQSRLKIHGGDEKVRQELIKNLSNSWKEFKKTYDGYFHSFSRNTSRTKILLQVITLGFLINSGRMLLDEYYFFGVKTRFFYLGVRELSYYVLVVIGFILLRTQTHQLLSLRGKTLEMERDTLFFPNGLFPEGDYEGLYNEFDPLEGGGEKVEKESQNSGGSSDRTSGTE
jgi:hypothetical protein